MDFYPINMAAAKFATEPDPSSWDAPDPRCEMGLAHSAAVRVPESNRYVKTSNKSLTG
jgi:hypothetical protein